MFIVIFELKKRKSVTIFTFFPFYLACSNGAICHDLSFYFIFSFKSALSLSSFTLIKRLFSSSLLSAIRVVSSSYLRLLMFLPPIHVHIFILFQVLFPYGLSYICFYWSVIALQCCVSFCCIF